MLDLIRQFIASFGLWRKMCGEQFASLLDAVNDAGSEVGFFEVAGHFLGQREPESIAALLMHGRVADDGELAGARRDKNQNAVPVMGFGHAEPIKLFLCRRDGVVHVFTADENADFAGSFLLGGLNGGDDVIVPQLVEKIFRFHVTSFLLRRRRQSCRRRQKNHHRHHRLKKILRQTNYCRCLTSRFRHNNDRWIDQTGRS